MNKIPPSDQFPHLKKHIQNWKTGHAEAKLNMALRGDLIVDKDEVKNLLPKEKDNGNEKGN